mmetsp:Transcript_17439/g.54639  ORF Transcript_17439/g.54639 Transcript_17439/m.54639 type:complete len:244 (+) Transcript_17439:197-928(+)
MARSTFAASIFRTNRTPMKRMLPIMRILYCTSPSLRSSASSSSSPLGGVRFRSKEAWHALRSIFLKVAFGLSLTGCSVKKSLSSEHKSPYMLMKWCCVVAFSKISEMRSSRWSAVRMPQETSWSESCGNFSRVNLLRMDFIARTTSAPSGSPPPVLRRARCRAAQEFSETSSLLRRSPRASETLSEVCLRASCCEASRQLLALGDSVAAGLACPGTSAATQWQASVSRRPSAAERQRSRSCRP